MEKVPVGRAATQERATSLAWAAMAVRTRILILFRSPLLIPLNTDMTRSWASFFGSIGLPRHPQRDPVMLEDRERQTVLVAVERAVRLADHHGAETAGRAFQFGEQRGRPRRWPGRR
jgi:hypothetical protein